MSIALSGRGLKCIDLHRIAHGEATSLCEDAAADMTENVASMPDGPSILEQKRHWLVGGFADTLSADELCRVFILGHCAGVGDPLAKPLVGAFTLIAEPAHESAMITIGTRIARILFFDFTMPSLASSCYTYRVSQHETSNFRSRLKY